MSRSSDAPASMRSRTAATAVRTRAVAGRPVAGRSRFVDSRRRILDKGKRRGTLMKPIVKCMFFILHFAVSLLAFYIVLSREIFFFNFLFLDFKFIIQKFLFNCNVVKSAISLADFYHKP